MTATAALAYIAASGTSAVARELLSLMPLAAALACLTLLGIGAWKRTPKVRDLVDDELGGEVGDDTIAMLRGDEDE